MASSQVEEYDEGVVVAVGMQYNVGPSFEFNPNMNIKLVREPSNPYDPNAVKVVVNGEFHAAYIGQRHSKQVANIMENGNVVHVRYEPETSKHNAATLVITCETPAMLRLKNAFESNPQ